MNEVLLALAPVLIGYLLGSIPFGYVVVKLARGIDIRRYGSHNIGATNVLRVVGPVPALVTLLGDIAKGTIPVIVAALPFFAVGGKPHPGVVIGAAVAAILGHAYSFYFWLLERKFARGKAIATGLGVLIGLVVAGLISPLGLAAPAAVWALTVTLPKLFQRRWGFVSLASILAAVSVPITLAITRDPWPYLAYTILVAVFVVWKHKENIGRLMDGVEPRLGERPPLAGHDDKESVVCAFMIHPISDVDWWQPRRFAWMQWLYKHRLLPRPIVKQVTRLIRPMKVDTIRGIQLTDGRQVTVHLIGVPWLPEVIKANPAGAVERAAQAACVARDLGASILGLGAFWSVIGNKGEDVQKAVPEFHITNGGAYTAGTVKKAVPMILDRLRERGVEPSQAKAAVIGANGVVGLGVCRQFANLMGTLVMIGTDKERLEKSANMLRRRSTAEILTSTDYTLCADCDVIFTATSDPNPVLFPQHVKPGAVIYDLGRPADVDDSVLAMREVCVIPGGVVRPPGKMQSRVDVHFGVGQIPACMAETILIAADQCFERKSLGDGTQAENIDHFVRRAEELGFVVVEQCPPVLA